MMDTDTTTDPGRNGGTVLWAFGGGNAATVAGRLAQAGARVSFAAAPPDATALVLIHDLPETVAATALVADEDPALALAAWGDAAELALEALKRNRRRTEVYALDQAGRALPRLRDRLGLGVGQPASLPPGLSPDPIRSLIAARAVAEDPRILRLSGMLEAAGRPLDNAPPSDTPVAPAIEAWKAAARDRAALETARTDRDALQALLSGAETAAAERQQQIDAMLEELAALGDAAGQRDVEAVRAREAEARAEATQAELDRVWASRSMRLTAPLRTVMRALGGRA